MILPPSPGYVQIWVRGSNSTPPLGQQYRPDQSAANQPGTNLRGSTFNMHSRIRIYGGFDTGMTALSERSPRIYRVKERSLSSG